MLWAGVRWTQALDSVTVAGVAAPRWVKLAHTGNLHRPVPADGKTWTDLKKLKRSTLDGKSQPTSPVYVGLCVTSHNGGNHDRGDVRRGRDRHGQRGLTKVATISDVHWQPTNSPTSLYRDDRDQRGQDHHGDQRHGRDLGRLGADEDPHK